MGLTRWASWAVESVGSGHWTHHAIGRAAVRRFDVETACSRVSMLGQIGGRHGFSFVWEREMRRGRDGTDTQAAKAG